MFAKGQECQGTKQHLCTVEWGVRSTDEGRLGIGISHRQLTTWSNNNAVHFDASELTCSSFLSP